MKDAWEILTKTATLATLISAAVGVLWYFVALEGRINQMEAQFQVLALAPALQPLDQVEANGASGSTSPVTIPNPLLATCAELAIRVADAIRRGSRISEGEPIERLMQRIGCER